MNDHEQNQPQELELRDADYAEGFSYLYVLLSHLTSSKTLFAHKIYVLMELSREIDRGAFTRADIEALFPQYPVKTLDSIVNSLIEGTWLVREEGTLHYTISRPGLLTLRFFPFLYKGDEMDEMAFQDALHDMFSAAEHMNLSLRSLELLRDQAIHAIQRNIAEIQSALISRNAERIREARQKMDQFIGNIDQLITRLKQIMHWKRGTDDGETDEKDKSSLDVLLHLKGKIMALYDEHHHSLSDSLMVGQGAFTKADIDRYLNHQSFYQLATFTKHTLYTPSNAKWVDEDDIVTALNIFLQRIKHVRKKTFSSRVYGYKEEAKQKGEPSYLDKVKYSLSDWFDRKPVVELDEFLFTQNNKTDALMFLAALCFLDGQTYYSGAHNGLDGFHLNVSHEAAQYSDRLFKTLSKGQIIRRDL